MRKPGPGSSAPRMNAGPSRHQGMLAGSNIRLPPEAAGITHQISLMSLGPDFNGALCFAAQTPAFIFNAGKGCFFFFLSLSHAFSS